MPRGVYKRLKPRYSPIPAVDETAFNSNVPELIALRAKCAKLETRVRDLESVIVNMLMDRNPPR